MSSLFSKLLLATSAALSAFTAPASSEPTPPAPLVQEGLLMQPVGTGTLHWFGFDIYDATLWTRDGTFANSFTEPVAFTLAYRRSLSRDRLISITRRGWSELELANAEQQDRWAASLKSIWVDVVRGSTLTTIALPGGETRFYDDTRLLGRIDDPAFGPAFLQIWVGERTANTALGSLRTQLLGGQTNPKAAHATK